MTYIAKPKFHHPTLQKNDVGFTRRDYEGSTSTLCAGCGHDSISAAIIEACWQLSIEPHRVAKISGIGCSSKTPDYFLGNSHGFNSVHGRMPSVLTGRDPITVDYAPGTVQFVEQHDGSRLALRKIDADYDPHDRLGAMTFLQKHAAQGQIVTGLLYVDPEAEDLHSHLNTVNRPLNRLEAEDLCPGSAVLDKINASLR